MFNESIKMALDGMLTNKLRTFLTLLGIIIGVGAVIAMVSLGFGVKEQIKSNISSLGSNLLIVMSGGRTPSGARLPMGEGARLTAEDAEAIEKQIDGIAHVAPGFRVLTSLLRATRTGRQVLKALRPIFSISAIISLRTGVI